MILYFSGSGNSKFVAKYLAILLKDEVVSLNKIIKENLSLDLNSDKPYVFVCPIYAWRFPLRIENLIKNSNLRGNNKFYFIATMGLNCGNADKYLKKITNSKNKNYMGFSKIIMPNNYLISDKPESSENITKIIQNAIPLIETFANKISNNEIIKYEKREFFGFLKSSFINYLFNKFFVNGKNLVVDENCIKCEKCIKLCPLNNISLVNDKIKISNNCMFCLSCLNNCPKNAITFMGKKNETYSCPSVEDFLKK